MDLLTSDGEFASHVAFLPNAIAFVRLAPQL